MIQSFFFFLKALTIRTNKFGNFSEVTAFSQAHQKKLVTMEQVHGSDFTERTEFIEKIPGVDGVLTSNSRLLLTVKTADCLPILLYHPSGIVGAIHAGRKSTQQEILKKVLTFLKNGKHITEGISLWFGPAICEECYQIDRQTDTHYSLIAENMAQAYQVFDPEKISLTVEGDCTECFSDEYHSYRVEGEGVQMNYFGIALK